MKHCENCGRFIGGRDIKRYCDGACRAAASRARRSGNARPRKGAPAHGHDIEWRGYLHYGTDRSTWGCGDCPAEWTSPLTVEKLEDVECAEQGREAA